MPQSKTDFANSNSRVSSYDSIIYDIDFLYKLDGIIDITPISYHQGICRELSIAYRVKLKGIKLSKPENSLITHDLFKFMKVTGNVLYSYNYRSYIDTPYAQSNIMQHLIQTNLNILVKEKYPFHITFSQRLSNSPFFANTSDVNLNFRQASLVENIKKDLRNELDHSYDQDIFHNPEELYNERKTKIGADSFALSLLEKDSTKIRLQKKFDSLYSIYEKDRKEYEEVQGWLQNKNLAQMIIEEREKRLRDSLQQLHPKRNNPENADARQDFTIANNQLITLGKDTVRQEKGSSDSLKSVGDTIRPLTTKTEEPTRQKDTIPLIDSLKIQPNSTQSFSEKIEKRKHQLDSLKNPIGLKLGQQKESLDSLKNPSDLVGKIFKHHRDSYHAKNNGNDSLKNNQNSASSTILKTEGRKNALDSLKNPANLLRRLLSRDTLRQKLNADSSDSKTDTVQTITQKIEQKKKRLDSLQQKISKSEQMLRLFQKKTSDSLLMVRKKINQINNSHDLAYYMKDHQSEQSKLSKTQKILLSINQIGIGRTWIDYSELTVKNISLSGVNIEMNPGNLYFAAAKGGVNYRFRDFVLRGNENTSSQSVSVIRAGIGRKDKNIVIATFYNGKKTMLNTVGTTNNPAATSPVMGVSLEAKYYIDVNTSFSAEFARSSYSNLPNEEPNNSGLLHKVFNLKRNENQAWSMKAATIYPETDTKLDAFYRKTGEAFQSFSLYSSNSKQDAWLVHVSQPLWKKRIVVDGSIKKNDFSSPIAAPDYSTSTVFKSLQVTVRIPKYPFATVGYYPSSQLLVGNNQVLYESQFNTLNVIVSHSYHLGSLDMNSNAVLTKFYNMSTDTGFIYYNASSVTFNHSIYLSPFILQATGSVADQSRMKLVTLEPGASYQYKQFLTLSASVKWSRLNSAETLWGGTAGMNLQLQKVGVFQIQYDKIYLPGYNNNLMPVDMGRVTFCRQF